MEGFEHHCIRGHDLHPEMGSMIDEIFRKVPLYHYQQSQLWFECSNEDVYEMVVTCHERNAVAVSIIKKIEYGIINKARYIVAGGPVYLNYGALESHLCYLKQIYLEKGIDLRIAPQFQVGESDNVDMLLVSNGFIRFSNVYGSYETTVVVNLGLTILEIRQGYTSALKRQLKLSQRKGIAIKVVTEAKDIHIISVMLKEFYRNNRLGLPGIDALECYLRNLVEKGAGRILIAEHYGRICAGIVLAGCGRKLVYLYGFRSPDISTHKLPLTHALHDEAIAWAKEHGYEQYDFGGYDTEDIESGINKFKLGFAGHKEEVSGDYIYVLNVFWSTLFTFARKLNMLFSREK